MKLVHPNIEHQFRFNGAGLNTLVIENQRFFYDLLYDICAQLHGASGDTVLSKQNCPLAFPTHIEIVREFIDFDINQKNLLNRLHVKMEKLALESEQYADTLWMLQKLESYILSLTADVPGEVILDKLNIGSLIKSVGLRLDNEYGEPLERIYDYMELVRELDGDKLFVFVNMRSYFTDEAVARFCDTVLRHQFCVLLIDASVHPLLPDEQRVLIDEDLCEIWQGIETLPE